MDIYPTYLDTYSVPGTSIPQTSAIASDGLVLSADGGTVYVDKLARGAQASIKSVDAILVLSSPRSASLSIANFLGSDYIVPPAELKLGMSILNVRNINQCQLDGCVSYTILKSDFIGSDGNRYNLPMRSVGMDVNWPPPATANCPYQNSIVRVEFHKAGYNGFTKKTWFVMPVLQTTLTAGYVPGPTFGSPGTACPNIAIPGTSAAPAAVATLQLAGFGGSYNLGQYHVPFYFKLEQR